jgi:hypothetical protein
MTPRLGVRDPGPPAPTLGRARGEAHNRRASRPLLYSYATPERYPRTLVPGYPQGHAATTLRRYVVGYASNPLNIDDSFRVGRARGYCNDYEDEDE